MEIWEILLSSPGSRCGGLRRFPVSGEGPGGVSPAIVAYIQELVLRWNCFRM